MRRKPNADTKQFIEKCKNDGWELDKVKQHLDEAEAAKMTIDLNSFIEEDPDESLSTLPSFFTVKGPHLPDGQSLIEKIFIDCDFDGTIQDLLKYECVRNTPLSLVTLSTLCARRNENFEDLCGILSSNDSANKASDAYYLLDINPDSLQQVDAMIQTLNNKQSLSQNNEEKFQNLFSSLPRQQIWRLFIDVPSQIMENGWFGFTNREENYLDCMAKGLIFIKNTINLPLSSQLLVGLHSSCTNDLGRITAGFRTPTDGFGFGFYGSNDFRHLPTITTAGYKELVSFSGQGGYEINAGANIRLTYDGTDERSIALAVNSTIDEYNTIIPTLTDTNEKLKAISKMISKLERIHPFCDGNCRTICMLLLNRELIKNNFPPVILYDPNCLDGWSTEEIILLLKNGMMNFKSLVNGNESIFGKTVEWLQKHGNGSEECEQINGGSPTASSPPLLESLLKMIDTLTNASIGLPEQKYSNNAPRFE